MNCRVDYEVINERNLHLLPDSCRALLFPLPYLAADETIGPLERFVRAGGFLYVSGDLAYSAFDLKRSHPERLTRLCGVHAAEPDQAGLTNLGPAATQVTPLPHGMTGLKRYSARLRLRLRLAGATAAAVDADGNPVTVVNTVGKGKVVFTADPLEVDPGILAASGMYRAFLDLAGAEPNRVAPDTPDLHCFSLNLTISIRAVWSDETISAAEKVDRIKWLNEIHHSVPSMAMELARGGPLWEGPDLGLDLKHWVTQNAAIGPLVNQAVLDSRQAVSGT